MNPAPYCRLWVSAFVLDTLHWPTEAVGAYFRLLCSQWLHGSIPTTDVDRERVAPGCSEHWSAYLEAKFRPIDGELRNPKMWEEQLWTAGRIGQCRTAGEASARARSVNGRSNDRSASVPTTVGTTVERPLERSFVSRSNGTGTIVATIREEENKTNPPNPPSGGVRARRRKATADPASEAVDRVFAAFPRRVGKVAAVRAIRRVAMQLVVDRNLDEVDALAMLESRVRALASKCSRECTETRFIPHPATWLNRGSWDDEDIRKAATAATIGPAASAARRVIGWALDGQRRLQRLLVAEGWTLDRVLEAARGDPDALRVDEIVTDPNHGDAWKRPPETIWRRENAAAS